MNKQTLRIFIFRLGSGPTWTGLRFRITWMLKKVAQTSTYVCIFVYPPAAPLKSFILAIKSMSTLHNPKTNAFNLMAKIKNIIRSWYFNYLNTLKLLTVKKVSNIY